MPTVRFSCDVSAALRLCRSHSPLPSLCSGFRPSASCASWFRRLGRQPALDFAIDGGPVAAGRVVSRLSNDTCALRTCQYHTRVLGQQVLSPSVQQPAACAHRQTPQLTCQFPGRLCAGAGNVKAESRIQRCAHGVNAAKPAPLDGRMHVGCRHSAVSQVRYQPRCGGQSASVDTQVTSIALCATDV